MTYDFREARITMTRQEALALLGFGPHDAPTEADAKKAVRSKLRDVHPDSGGSTFAMQEVNRAYDLLFPKKPQPLYREDPGSSQPVPQTEPSRVDDAPPRQQWTPPKDVVVTWEQARAGAGIPGGVEWQFTTATQRDKGGYSGDESSFSRHAYAYYGRTADQHVFVVAVHVSRSDYYVGGGGRRDVWDMQTHKLPIKKDEQSNLVWLHRQISTAFGLPIGDFEYNGRFNSKVRDARGWSLSEKLPASPEISLKHWLVESGQVAGDAPAVAGRKQVVELKLHVATFGPEPGHYNDPKAGAYNKDGYQVTLVLNGKPVVLGEHDTVALISVRLGGKRLLNAVFGEYFYQGGSKVLTRMQKGKVILEWMVQKLTGISDDTRAVLQAAAAQMK